MVEQGEVKVQTGVFANDRLRLSVTDSCNFRCSYCTNEGQLHNTGKLIDTGLVEKLADKILEENIYVRKVNITGGETLLHPRITDIARACSRISDSVTINTNGELLSRDKILELHEAGVKNIKFGIDSFFQDMTKPNYVRRACHPDRIIANLLFAIEIMPRSSVNIVLTEFNDHEIGGMLQFIVDNNINWVEFLELIDYDFRGLSVMPLPGPRLRSILEEYKWLFEEVTYNSRLAKYVCRTYNGLTIQFAEDFCARRVCQNLWTRVDSWGRLVPCIKAHAGDPMDFDCSLADQVRKCNSMMCNGLVGHLPRDSSGIVLTTGEKGSYVESMDWSAMVSASVKETTADP